MKVSFFETAHYLSPRQLPAEWPVPPAPTIAMPVHDLIAGWSNGCSLSRNWALTGSAWPSTTIRHNG